MGLWDEIVDGVKNVVKVCDEGIKTISHSAETSSEFSVKDKLIEKSLWGVRKYYNTKIDMVNKVSDIEPEWYFWDEVSQENKVCKKNKKVEECKVQKQKYEEKIKSLKSDIIAYLGDIKKLRSVVDELEVEDKQSNLAIINNKKDLISEKSENINKLEVEIKRIEDCKKILMEEIYKINEELLIAKSLLSNDYEKCRVFAISEGINNAFSEYGLRCLEEYTRQNFSVAKELVIKYFVRLEYKAEKITHPILLYVLAQKSFDDGNYKVALELMLKPIKLYPDSREMHEFLKNVHYKLGHVEQYKLENKIIELLS